MRVTILGSGTSHGVPSVGCDCAVCTSPDPRNRRTRCSIAVEWEGVTFLVDTAPELRQQAIRSRLRRVDALLYTHSHADHLFGLDDVRRYCEAQGDLPVFATADTLRDLERAYRYVFVPTQMGGGKPRLTLTALEGDRLEWGGRSVDVIPVFHGGLEIRAYRFGDFAYVTDVSRIPDESRRRLQGLDTLVLGALRWDPHPTHFNVDQALAAVADLKPRRTFFTHIAHDLDHAEVERRLPPDVRLAYDGLVLSVGE